MTARLIDQRGVCEPCRLGNHEGHVTTLGGICIGCACQVRLWPSALRCNDCEGRNRHGIPCTGCTL